jgi:hypothetical protein
MSAEVLTSADCTAKGEPRGLVADSLYDGQIEQTLGVTQGGDGIRGPVWRLSSRIRRFAARRTSRNPDSPNDRLSNCASLASPLILAAIVVLGFAVLCMENLNGRVGGRQFRDDHSTAIQKLLFRP